MAAMMVVRQLAVVFGSPGPPGMEHEISSAGGRLAQVPCGRAPRSWCEFVAWASELLRTQVHAPKIKRICELARGISCRSPRRAVSGIST